MLTLMAARCRVLVPNGGKQKKATNRAPGQQAQCVKVAADLSYVLGDTVLVVRAVVRDSVTVTPVGCKV